MEKLEKMLTLYKERLERKSGMVDRIHAKQNKEELNIQEKINLFIQEAELQQLKEFVEDLKYLKL